MKSLFFRISIVASEATWDYSQNGKDWPNIEGFEGCGLPNQSPINLNSMNSPEFEYTVIRAKDDDFIKSYSNQFDTQVNFNGHTSQVDLTGTNMFKSSIAKDNFGGPSEFKGL